jgi:hypothetical protein
MELLLRRGTRSWPSWRVKPGAIRRKLRDLLRGFGLAEAAIAFLLASTLWLPALVGGKAWPLALVFLLLAAVWKAVRERRLGPVPPFLLAYVAVYAAAAVHGGTLSASDAGRYFLRPFAAVAVATLVTSAAQRRRALWLVVLFVSVEIPVTAGQAIKNIFQYGRGATVGVDSVTGTLGSSQGVTLTLVALAVVALVAGAWLAGVVSRRHALAATTGLIAIGVFSATRSILALVVAVGGGTTAVGFCFGRERPSTRSLLLVLGASVVAVPLLYGATRAIYPRAYVGIVSDQTTSVLGGSAAQGVQPPLGRASSVTRPPFAIGSSDWSGSRGARVRSDRSVVFRGRPVLRLATNGRRNNAAAQWSGPWPVTSGETMVASAFVKGRPAQVVSINLSDGLTEVGRTFTLSGGWDRIAVAKRFRRNALPLIEITPPAKQAATIAIGSAQLTVGSAAAAAARSGPSHPRPSPQPHQANPAARSVHPRPSPQPHQANPAPRSVHPRPSPQPHQANPAPHSVHSRPSSHRHRAATAPRRVQPGFLPHVNVTAPSPSGVELLPGRLLQLKLAARLSFQSGPVVAMLGRGPGSTELDPRYDRAQDVPLAQRTGPTWIGRILTETGWFGLIAFFALLGWTALLGRQLWRQTAHASADRALGASLPGVAAVTVVAGALATILDIRGYSALFWLLLGLAISGVHERRHASSPAGPDRPAAH